MGDDRSRNPELEGAGWRRSEHDAPAGLSQVLREYDVEKAQRERRRSLLEVVESLGAKDGRKAGALAFICSDAGALDAGDVPAFGDALLSIGDVDDLNLIMDSPGGDGTIAERVLGLCPSYCSRLRVVVPQEPRAPRR